MAGVGGWGTGGRLDHLLVERGLAESRSRAQALVLAGSVEVGGRVVTKAGLRVPPQEEVSVREESPFVSRSGEKLAAALDRFGVVAAGRCAVDAGASTGGFTDALLQRGASGVVAVDVGYGQLDWRLRNDPRVTVLERTNVRRLSGGDLPFRPDLVVADLSFISLGVALRGILSSTPEVREAVVLVKPQFEAGPGEVGRGGVVRDPEVHRAVILQTAGEFSGLGFGAVDVMRSPVAGRRSGNREYPLHLLRGPGPGLPEERVREAVEG